MTGDNRDNQEYPPVSFERRGSAANPRVAITPPLPTKRKPSIADRIILVLILLPLCAAILLIMYAVRQASRPDLPAATLPSLSLEPIAPISLSTPDTAEAKPTIAPTEPPTATPTITPNWQATDDMQAVIIEQDRLNANATDVSMRLTEVQDESDRLDLENKRREVELAAEVLNSAKAAEHVKQTAIWDGATATAEIQNLKATSAADQITREMEVIAAEKRLEIDEAENKSANDMRIQDTIRFVLQALLILGGFIIAGLIYALYRWERLQRKSAALHSQRIQRANANRTISDIYKDVDRENAIELWSLLKSAVVYYDKLKKEGNKQITIPSHTLTKWSGGGKWKRVTDVLAKRHHLRKTPQGSQLVYGNLEDWINIIERGYLYDADPIGRLDLDKAKK